MLRHQDYKEADRILTIFTRQFGKVTAVGRGVRKQNSRKGRAFGLDEPCADSSGEGGRGLM